MKIVFKILFIVFYCSASFAQSGWVIRTVDSNPIVSIHFFNRDSLTAYGSTGLIFTTSNQGAVWYNRTSPNDGTYLTKNLDSGFAYAAGSVDFVGMISYTSNGGSNWNVSNVYAPSGGYCILHSLATVNRSLAFAGGVDFNLQTGSYRGLVYKTSNNGINWQNIFNVPGTDISDIYFKNANEGILLGYKDLYKTTNGGTNFVYTDSTPFYSNSFTNPFKDTIFICGKFGKIARSINGGINWNIYTMPSSSQLNKIIAINSKIVYTCGDSGKVYKTTNAGENWIDQSINQNLRFRDINFFDELTGFIVGDGGRIIRTTSGGPVFVSNPAIFFPNQYSLSQNYPNPFNPTTNINYDLPNHDFVSLRVFDIMGKEMETLVHEKQSAGSYSVTFNASAYPSGVYFYKLETGSFSETKKMMVVK